MDTTGEVPVPGVEAADHATGEWLALDRSTTTDILHTALTDAGLVAYRIHPEAILEIWQVFGGHPEYIKKFCRCVANHRPSTRHAIIDKKWVDDVLSSLKMQGSSDDPWINEVTDSMVRQLLGVEEGVVEQLVRRVVRASEVDKQSHLIRGEVKVSGLNSNEKASVATKPDLFFKFNRDGEVYLRLRIQWWRFTNV